jgi:APA family basic amino acid/polyamine antiporter
VIEDMTSGLKKEIGWRQLFSLAFGTIIGIGWVTVLGQWLVQAGSLGAILGFAGGGIVMIFVGLCYAEMASMFPVSGGEVAYSYEVYGLQTTFLTGWMLALTFIGVVAFEVISVGWIGSVVFPSLKGPLLYRISGDGVNLGSLLMALASGVGVSWLNYRGAKMAATFQYVAVWGLLLTSLIFITVGLVGGEASYLEPLFVRSKSGSVWLGVVGIFATAPFWYSGFDTIAQAMGEKKEGASLHLVGRVIVVAIVAAMLFYGLVIASTSMTMPRSELTALELPTAAAFQAAFRSPFLGKLVLMAGLLGLLTTLNAFFFAATRVLYALGQSRVLPPFFSTVHPVLGTPVGAVVFVAFLCMLLAFLGRSAIMPIVNSGSASLGLVFLLTCVGVLRLRRKQPQRVRPYRAPGLWMVIAGIAGSVLMLLIAIYLPYSAAEGRFPMEWTFILVWSAFGVVCWRAGKSIRQGISEPERRRLMLGEE